MLSKSERVECIIPSTLYSIVYELSDKIKMEKYCTVSHLVKFVFFPFYFFSDFVKSLLIKINIDW